MCDFTQQGTGMAPKNVPQPMNVKKSTAAPTQPKAPFKDRVNNMKPSGGMGAGGSKEMEVLSTQVSELQANNQILDKEREFYFSKLRLIEEMIQKNGYETDPLGDTVLKILYAGEDESMDINPEGNLIISAGGQELVHKIEKKVSENKTDEMAD